jgi:16S rRNA (adenine1518-N6/adenine1519-N6)-dimethyltransferase
MVRPKKHLGQHFLQDENIARKIVGLLPANSGVVVEVGAGTGVLSKFLLEQKFQEIFFFEIDTESITFLKNRYPSITDHLIEADFLAYDLAALPSPFILIGNFPYNISSQILFRVLENRNIVPEVIGMFQKEVAERIASPPGSKKYGILSVLLQAYYTIEYVFTVSEHVFFPPPKVKSGVIRLKRNSVLKLDCDETLFHQVVKTAFNQRRKTLRNALKGLIDGSSEELTVLLGKRAEQLSVDEFVFLTRSAESFSANTLKD